MENMKPHTGTVNCETCNFAAKTCGRVATFKRRNGTLVKTVLRVCPRGHKAWYTHMSEGAKCVAPFVSNRYTGEECAFPNCGRPRRTTGSGGRERWCHGHARQARKHGPELLVALRAYAPREPKPTRGKRGVK